MILRNNKISCVFLALLVLFPNGKSYAQSSLLITTPRVIFEGRDRSASVNLKNVGDSLGHYRVYFSEKKMIPNGTVQSLSPGEQASWSAAHMVRFAPSRVNLQAGAGQTIRLALRKPAELPPGEYRSHLVFRGDPSNRSSAKSTGQVTTNFAPTFEFSIPVIIRHGKTFATVSLSNPHWQKRGSKMRLGLDVIRTGNRSLYGDFRVLGLEQLGGAPTLLFEQKGYALYTPLLQRKAYIDLPPNVSLKGFTHLKIQFIERKEYGGNERAEVLLAL